MRNPEISIKLATPESPVYKTIPPAPGENSEVLEYYAAYMAVGCTPYGDEGEGTYVLRERYLGAAKDRPWTLQDLATTLKNASTLNTIIYNEVKAVYQEAINLVIEN
jgi:hypothetical protein